MPQAPLFGDLLRRYRVGAALTQEALAERAGLSARAISDLERGRRLAPHQETVRLLADALQLDAPAREALQVSARRPRSTATLRTPSHAARVFGAGTAPRLVGRLRELQALRARLDGAQAGLGGLVLVAGEPGIGKTRLVEELATEAGQRGMLVLWGRCWENEGAPPFWPWVEILRGILHGAGAARLRAELGAAAPLIADLVPEVREQLPDLPPVPLLEPGEARFRLFDAVTAALRDRSRAQPVLVVLDDLHWADKPSLLLLQFLLQYPSGSRVLVLGTYRDTELAHDRPLAELLGSLRGEPSCESLALKGLTVAAVSELVSSCLDHLVSSDTAALAQALWQVADGNPLFVCEELRLLTDGARLVLDLPGDDIPAWILGLGLPQGIRDVISRRLTRLAEETRGLLTVAAVVGREFEVGTVATSGGLDEMVVDTALDEAQADGVIEELPVGIGRYRFKHALFREVLYAALPVRRRKRLHGQVAQALEQAYAHDLDAQLSALAHHFGEAQALLGTEKLVHYSLLAGERALASMAYEEAAVHFQRGLEVKAGRPMDDEQAALLSGLGRAQTATAELVRAHEVVANLGRAFDFYAAAGDLDRAVAIAECPVDALPGQSVGAAQLVARALALVEPDSHAAGRLLARYARMAAIEEGNYAAAAAACTQALVIARREGDRGLEIQALGNGAEADLNFMHWQAGLEKCLQAVELASRTQAPQVQLLARFFAGIILWFQGDLARAGEQASALLAQAEQLHDRRWLVNALWIDGTLACYRGDWAAARNATDRGLALSPADPRLLWTRILLERELGHLSRATLLRGRLLEVVPLTIPRPDLAQVSTGLIVAVAASEGQTEPTVYLAETAAAAILSFPSATAMVLRVARACLATIALRRRDAAAAGRQYQPLTAARGTIIYEGMAADRLLGLIAELLGNDGAARAHFEDALRFCRSRGCRPELAWSCYDYAKLLRSVDEPGEQARARSLLDEAGAIARELEMALLLEQLLGLHKCVKA